MITVFTEGGYKYEIDIINKTVTRSRRRNNLTIQHFERQIYKSISDPKIGKSFIYTYDKIPGLGETEITYKASPVIMILRDIEDVDI